MEGLVDEPGFRLVRVVPVEESVAGADVDHAAAWGREGHYAHLASFAQGFAVSVVEAQQAEIGRAGLAENLEIFRQGSPALVRELGKEPLTRGSGQPPSGAGESLLDCHHVEGC